MGKPEFWNLSEVSDEHLLQSLKGFIASGARVDASVVAHLAEVEERRLHLKAACSSLFDYCLRRLGLSEGEAFYRITAARLARRFPAIFELLEARAIHLSALRVLRDHLTNDNHCELLAAASGKSKKEVEVLVAALAPKPDVVARIRKLPTTHRALPSAGGACSPALVRDLASTSAADASSLPDRQPSSSPVRELTLGAEAQVGLGGRMQCGERLGSAAPRARNSVGTRTLEPLSSARYLLRLSVSGEIKDKLERARDLMSHGNPSGELELVLERALDVLLEKLEQQRFARTERPRAARKVPPEPSPPRTGIARSVSQGREPRLDREYAKPEDAGPIFSSGAELGSAWPNPSSEVAGKPSLQHGQVAEEESQRGESRRLGGCEYCEQEEAGPSASNNEARMPIRVASGAGRTRREHIPNEVRRTVAKRDGLQCTYVDDEGRRCPSRAFLQLHHEQAHALGGPSTLENLRLLCASHNRLLAEQDFGRAHQDRLIRGKQRSNAESDAFGRR